MYIYVLICTRYGSTRSSGAFKLKLLIVQNAPSPKNKRSLGQYFLFLTWCPVLRVTGKLIRDRNRSSAPDDSSVLTKGEGGEGRGWFLYILALLGGRGVGARVCWSWLMCRQICSARYGPTPRPRGGTCLWPRCCLSDPRDTVVIKRIPVRRAEP